MKKSTKIFSLILVSIFIFASCGGKTTAQCKNDIRAYEYGREMHTWVLLRSNGLSLEDAIEEYSEGLGISPPYEAINDCVKQGFEDASNDIESPYNKDGKSWSTF